MTANELENVCMYVVIKFISSVEKGFMSQPFNKIFLPSQVSQSVKGSFLNYVDKTR